MNSLKIRDSDNRRDSIEFTFYSEGSMDTLVEVAYLPKGENELTRVFLSIDDDDLAVLRDNLIMYLEETIGR